MITNADITKLKGVFASKEELADVKVELGEVHDTLDTMASALDTVARTVVRIENTLDGMTGAIHRLDTENGAGAAHLARHDRQISALAVHAHIQLPA